MKRLPLMYLETSIFGFYYDDEERNALRREAVRRLFRQVESGLLRAGISRLTQQELSRTAGTSRAALLTLAALAQTLEPDDAEVGRLAAQYVSDRIIPATYAADALHAASAAVSGCELLVTLNLKHLANEWAERLLNSVNLREGYLPIRIRMPEEVLHYED